MLVSWPQSRGNARGISYNWTRLSLPILKLIAYLFIQKNIIFAWNDRYTSGTNNFRINFLHQFEIFNVDQAGLHSWKLQLVCKFNRRRGTNLITKFEDHILSDRVHHFTRVGIILTNIHPGWMRGFNKFACIKRIVLPRFFSINLYFLFLIPLSLLAFSISFINNVRNHLYFYINAKKLILIDRC